MRTPSRRPMLALALVLLAALAAAPAHAQDAGEACPHQKGRQPALNDVLRAHQEWINNVDWRHPAGPGRAILCNAALNSAIGAIAREVAALPRSVPRLEDLMSWRVAEQLRAHPASRAREAGEMHQRLGLNPVVVEMQRQADRLAELTRFIRGHWRSRPCPARRYARRWAIMFRRIV